MKATKLIVGCIGLLLLGLSVGLFQATSPAAYPLAVLGLALNVGVNMASALWDSL